MHLCDPLSVNGYDLNDFVNGYDLNDFDDYYCALLCPSDVRDKLNQTPLHKSCDGGPLGRGDLVQYLIERVHCDVSKYPTYSYNINASII